MKRSFFSLAAALSLTLAPALATEGEADPQDLSDPSDSSDQSDLSAQPEQPPADDPGPQAAPPSDWEQRVERVNILRAGERRTVEVMPADPEAYSGAATGAVPRLSAPFTPRPSAPPPAGWRLVADPDVPAITFLATLNDGSQAEFQVTPPVLLPSRQVPEEYVLRFTGVGDVPSIREVSELLFRSSRELDSTARDLGEIIPRMRAALDSSNERNDP